MDFTVGRHLVAKRKIEVSKVTEIYWNQPEKKRHPLPDKDILKPSFMVILMFLVSFRRVSVAQSGKTLGAVRFMAKCTLPRALE